MTPGEQRKQIVICVKHAISSCCFANLDVIRFPDNPERFPTQ